jgi:hypothetical protein
MVVDDVEHDREATRVARVDEDLEPLPRGPENSCTGISSTCVTPSATRWSSRSTTAVKVPSGVKVPTCSSYMIASRQAGGCHSRSLQAKAAWSTRRDGA